MALAKAPAVHTREEHAHRASMLSDRLADVGSQLFLRSAGRPPVWPRHGHAGLRSRGGGSATNSDASRYVSTENRKNAEATIKTWTTGGSPEREALRRRLANAQAALALVGGVDLSSEEAAGVARQGRKAACGRTPGRARRARSAVLGRPAQAAVKRATPTKPAPTLAGHLAEARCQREVSVQAWTDTLTAALASPVQLP
jgi:hypothetical protein